MQGNFEEISNEVEFEQREIYITCNGWEVELTYEESKKVIDYLREISPIR